MLDNLQVATNFTSARHCDGLVVSPSYPVFPILCFIKLKLLTCQRYTTHLPVSCITRLTDTRVLGHSRPT